MAPIPLDLQKKSEIRIPDIFQEKPREIIGMDKCEGFRFLAGIVQILSWNVPFWVIL